jgi:hypothetical protein
MPAGILKLFTKTTTHDLAAEYTSRALHNATTKTGIYRQNVLNAATKDMLQRLL